VDQPFKEMIWGCLGLLAETLSSGQKRAFTDVLKILTPEEKASVMQYAATIQKHLESEKNLTSQEKRTVMCQFTMRHIDVTFRERLREHLE